MEFVKTNVFLMELLHIFSRIFQFFQAKKINIKWPDGGSF